MKEEYMFIEDSRKYRKFVIILTIIFYICTIAFASIMSYEIITQKYELGLLRSIICIICCLALALYLTWALNSKYLKYYMYINQDKIIFFDENKEYIYNTIEFINFSVIKNKDKYKVYKLTFNDRCHIISSFVPERFEKTLNKIKML